MQTKTYDQVLKSTQKWDMDVKRSVLSRMQNGAQKSTFRGFFGGVISEKFSFSPPFECMSWSYLAFNQEYIVQVFTRRKATISSVHCFDVFVSDSRTHYEASFFYSHCRKIHRNPLSRIDGNAFKGLSRLEDL